MNQNSNQGIAMLRQLKGPALPVLISMLLSGADTIHPQWIESATGLSSGSVIAGLRSLSALGLADQLSRYQWRLSTGYKQIGILEDVSGKICQSLGSSSRDSESIKYIDSTTTTEASGKFCQSLVDLLIAMGCSREKAVSAINSALRRGETELQIRSRINSCKESKFKPRYPRGFWAASVVADGRAIPEAEAQPSRNYDGYLDAME